MSAGLCGGCAGAPLRNLRAPPESHPRPRGRVLLLLLLFPPSPRGAGTPQDPGDYKGRAEGAGGDARDAYREADTPSRIKDARPFWSRAPACLPAYVVEGGRFEPATRPCTPLARSKMLAGCAEGCYRFLAFLAAASCLSAGAEAAAATGSAPFHAKGNAVHSNAIKIPPPETSVASVSPAPGESHQRFLACAGDEDCKAEEFCPNSARGGVHGTPACLACRRRRKRCFRDAMCCPGNYCYHGMCVPLEHDQLHPGEIEEGVIENVDHGATDFHPKRTTSSSQLHHLKGQEGAVCLRSSDCAEGLCCARHFWSKICKPVLMEGQVCTKHRKKGAHGLEIFQRCNCGDGLTCRLQKDHTSNSSSRLHTCQRH